MLVSDDQVAPHYAALVKKQLTAAGYTVYEYVFPHGETEKNAARLLDLVEFMAAKALTRKDLLIALGGGVVGDMAGLRRPPIYGASTISRCLHPYWLQLIHLLAVKRPLI